jgi:hypothetical protein
MKRSRRSGRRGKREQGSNLHNEEDICRLLGSPFPPYRTETSCHNQSKNMSFSITLSAVSVHLQSQTRLLRRPLRRLFRPMQQLRSQPVNFQTCLSANHRKHWIGEPPTLSLVRTRMLSSLMETQKHSGHNRRIYEPSQRKRNLTSGRTVRGKHDAGLDHPIRLAHAAATGTRLSSWSASPCPSEDAVPGQPVGMWLSRRRLVSYLLLTCSVHRNIRITPSGPRFELFCNVQTHFVEIGSSQPTASLNASALVMPSLGTWA